MRTSPFIASAVLLALASAVGVAQAASHNRDKFILEQDLNKDGKVSKDEFAAGRDSEFARMDPDHNGGLSHDEYVNDFKGRLGSILAETPADKREEQRQRELRQVEVRFGVLDTDKSGEISRAEFAYSGWMMFAHHDTNKDGFVGSDDVVDKDDN
jgi:hypothetical protein